MIAPVKSAIRFDHIGIGEVLRNNLLRAPLNQREYTWEDKHVDDLLADFSNAMGNQGSHFLGTIVLTRGAGDIPEVADGQQRSSSGRCASLSSGGAEGCSTGTTP